MNYYSNKRVLYAFIGVFMGLFGITFFVIALIYSRIFIGILAVMLFVISVLPLLESKGINHVSLTNEKLTIYRYPFYVEQVKLENIKELAQDKNWLNQDMLLIKTNDKIIKIYDSYDKKISIIKHDINNYLMTDYD